MRVAAAPSTAQPPQRGRRAFAGGRRAGPALVAWIAVFGLYLQLAAAAMCLSGSPVAGPRIDAPAALAGSQICHGQGGDQGDDRGGGRSGSAHGACPFCSLHGQLGLVAAPPPHPAAPVTAVAEPIEPPWFAARPLSRRPTDAAPRGPPVLG